MNGLDTGGSRKHLSKHPFFSNIAGAILPCSKKSRQNHRDEKTENVETMSKLLDGETASKKAVDDRPNPSAPIEDHTVVPCDTYLHRQESFPVQASS